MIWPYSVSRERKRLLGSVAQIWVHGHSPALQQPFRDVASIFVAFAPVLQFERLSARLFVQSESSDFIFKTGWTWWATLGRSPTGPIRIVRPESHREPTVKMAGMIRLLAPPLQFAARSGRETLCDSMSKSDMEILQQLTCLVERCPVFTCISSVSV